MLITWLTIFKNLENWVYKGRHTHIISYHLYKILGNANARV